MVRLTKSVIGSLLTAAIGRPYKRKDQCAQVALAFDNVVGTRGGVGGGEGEGQVQPPELGFDASDVRPEKAGEVAKLLADPV